MKTYFQELNLQKEVGFRHSQQQQQQLQQLNAALYSPHASQWQGDALWQSWQQYQRQATPGTTDNSLGGLYPHSGAD